MNADWELAERNGWRMNFDETLLGCLFHLGQAHWRKVQDLGLSVEYIENGKVCVFVWKVLSMSHVPLERHQEAIAHLETLMDSFRIHVNDSPEANHLYRKVRDYFDYFMTVWMNGRFHVTEWNFFEINDNTTTNAAESTNWRFQVKTGKHKPNVYLSVDSIKDDIKETERLIDLLQMGRLTKRRNFPFEKRQSQRGRLKLMLGMDQITLSSYMTTMGALNLKLDSRTKLKLRQVAAEIVSEQNVPLHNRRQTIDQIVAVAVNDHIQRVLPGEGAMGGQVPGAVQHHNGLPLPNGRMRCENCDRTYTVGRFANHRCQGAVGGHLQGAVDGRDRP